MTMELNPVIGPFFGLQFGRPVRLTTPAAIVALSIAHKDAPAARSGARVSNGKARSGRILDRSTARNSEYCSRWGLRWWRCRISPSERPVLSAPRLHLVGFTATNVITLDRVGPVRVPLRPRSVVGHRVHLNA